MIGIGKDKLLTCRVGITKVDSLEGRIGPHGHKARRINSPVWCMYPPDKCLTFGRLMEYLQGKEITALVGPFENSDGPGGGGYSTG